MSFVRECVFEQFRIICQNPKKNSETLCFSREKAEKALRFHKSIPSYRVTSLIGLKDAARQNGIKSIYVKDESSRFGLKAFKGLGGSYCMFRILCEKLGLDESSSDYTTFLSEEIRQACSQIEFVTATDGNHGKGISWAAKLFGCKAHVFMPKGTVEARRKAIEEAGSAVAEITGWNYDRTVQHAEPFGHSSSR